MKTVCQDGNNNNNNNHHFTVLCPGNKWELNLPPQKPPFPLVHVDPCITHPSLQWPHWLPQTTAQSVHTIPHNYATKSPLVTMGCPNSSPILPLALRWSPPPSSTPIPQPSPLTISNEIRIQSVVLPQYTFWTVTQTDTHTDRSDKWQVYTISAYDGYIDR